MLYFQHLKNQSVNNTTMSNIAEHLLKINTVLDANRCTFPDERSNSKLRLLAVSKGQQLGKIREAYQLGIRRFGENYVQEALEKMASLKGLNIEWHFIGTIQSNKCKSIAENFAWIQSIDRLSIAEKLNRFCPIEKNLQICIQINMDNEIQKSGVALHEIESFCQKIQGFSRLRLRGLMLIPKDTESVSEQRQTFAKMAQIFYKLQTLYPQMDTLSMGMSDDYELALAEGSTMVRIGTALFGSRS